MSDYIRESETRELRRQRMKRQRRKVMLMRILVIAVILIIVLLSLFMCKSKKNTEVETTTKSSSKATTTKVKETKVVAGLTEDEMGENDPLFLQKDIRWGNKKYGDSTIGRAGCGPVCLSMVVFSLTRDDSITPDKVAKYAEENGHYVKNAGTAWSLFTEGGKHYGLKVSGLSISETEMKNALDKGAKLILSVKAGVFSGASHIIEIYGYDKSGFKVNEPLSEKRSSKTYKFDQFKDIIKAIWAYTN